MPVWRCVLCPEKEFKSEEGLRIHKSKDAKHRQRDLKAAQADVEKRQQQQQQQQHALPSVSADQFETSLLINMSYTSLLSTHHRD